MKLIHGFTLLEILLVVVIIGILAGLGIPKFYKSIESAKGKEALVQLELIRTADRMYTLDHNGQHSRDVITGTTFGGSAPGSLTPGYLPDDPNAKIVANPNSEQNWGYGFSDNLSINYGNIWAVRRSGRYAYGTPPPPSQHYIGMYLNGDMVNSGMCAWPWPPN